VQLRSSLIQEQRLKMSPQVYQSIKLMELPLSELRESIAAELERNPALELVKDPLTLSLESAVPARKEAYDYFEGSSDSGYLRRGGEEAAEAQRRFIEGALSRPETLQEHLLWQLRLEPLDAETRRVGEVLIQNLDHDGFHKERVDALLPGEPWTRVQAAMRVVQALDPVGTCTADYRESLYVQISLLQDAPSGMLEALSYLEVLDKLKPADLAKKLNLSLAQTQVLLARLRGLSPFPGRQFASGETRYVVPDVQVYRKDGDFVILLNHEEIPVLGISPFFMRISGTSGGDKPARDFAKETVKEARWFIQSINRRNHTLLKVCRAIIEFQRPFFMHGPKYLAPLTLRDIAGDLGVHETTVSRTAHGKYMQTEWGIFEVRHFFTNSISGTGSGGSRFSKEGVKAVIRELIAGETRHLSDQEITGLLAQQGIRLARRTVSKYRHELDLGPSYNR
jgi:RNA polymerase sigma-54 factor